MIPLSTLEEALELALVRNECREFMTNDQGEISQAAQTRWFREVYRQQSPQKYWVWLLKETRVIGYFAAKETEEGIYITEGLLKEKRGMGLGTFMLRSMLPHFESKPIYADIFEQNLSSIALHKKFDFKEERKIDERIIRFRRVAC